jgi:hypothetical protein
VKLTLSFPELDRVRRVMGAPLRQWRAELSAPPPPPPSIIYEPIEREIESLDPLEVGPADTIIIDGRRVFLYIREWRRFRGETFEEATNAPEQLPRFHVVWCRTLHEMKAEGRFERYVASERVEEPFGIALRTVDGQWVCGDAELLVCRNCLTQTNWMGYRDATRKQRDRIVAGFSRRRFLETDTTRFQELPRANDDQPPPLGYAADWAERSAAYRASVQWRCEACGVDCSRHRGLLDTHHRNGVVSDNRASNLRALCKLCHAKEHPNWYRVASKDHRTLEELRRAAAS